MSTGAKAYIAGVGMITPVGSNTEMTAMSVRAGINRYQETEYLGQNFDPVRMALVPDEAFTVKLEGYVAPNIKSSRQARLLQLVGTAAAELIPLMEPDVKVPLFIAGPEATTASKPDVDSTFLKNLSDITGMNIDLQSSRCISTGRSGGLEAIDLAVRYLDSKYGSCAVVGGVDSFYDLEVLARYVKDERILGSDSMDGFVPGEAAGLIVLRSLEELDTVKHRSFARVFATGVGCEDGHIQSKAPYLGNGLASAFSRVLKSARPGAVTHIYSSMNGEGYFSKELGVAMMRNSEYIHEDCTVHHPADCFGDLGAALGVVLTGLANFEIVIGGGEDTYLVYCSSDKEYRSAVWLG